MGTTNKETRWRGQPRIIATPEEFEKKVNEYFEKWVKKKKIKNKDGSHSEVEFPTITGLCLYLGFSSKYSFYDYEELPEFSQCVKKARTRIEQHYEELLQWSTPAGPIFALKNFGRSDRREIANTHEIDSSIKKFMDDVRSSSIDTD